MPIVQPKFTPGHYYHLYNRGVAKQVIFHDNRDYYRFLDTLAFYTDDSTSDKKFSTTEWEIIKDIRYTNPGKSRVEIIAHCIMPNHFHLLVKQIEENGISMFLRRSLNSYTHYYNTKRKRVGPIFQGTFRATIVENNEQLLHVSRYIHLNPFVAKIVDSPSIYQYSSYQAFLHGAKDRLCSPSLILELVNSNDEYRQFVEDYADYARSIGDLKKLLIDPLG